MLVYDLKTLEVVHILTGSTDRILKAYQFEVIIYWNNDLSEINNHQSIHK